jgi:putative hydrolase of the HAD superfamily
MVFFEGYRPRDSLGRFFICGIVCFKAGPIAQFCMELVTLYEYFCREDKTDMIRAVLFDFGGVVAEEGFQAGLYAIAEHFGLDSEDFFQAATEAVYRSGYVTGTGTEADFWELVRAGSGIVASDEELRREILCRFIPRPGMLEIVRVLRRQGCIAAILSDQSDWLDRLDREHHFFHEFDRVFNSYHLGKTKRDPTIFDDTVNALRVAAQQTLFVDDNPDHIDRAAGKGLLTHLYKNRATLEKDLKRYSLF